MIKVFADWLTYKILSIAQGTHLADAVNFFIYDTIKIFLLLASIIFVVSFIRTYLPPEKIKKILSQKGKYTGNITAALLGIIMPFCTCSAITLFLGFVEVGVPLGVVFSFLVASPMINEVALVLLLATFGVKIALIYIASGLIIAIISGIIIGKLKPEKLLEKSFFENGAGKKNSGGSVMALGERIDYAKNYMLGIIKRVWLYIVIGVGAGAWIHGYLPVDFMAQYASADKWYAVLVAVLIGVPLYSNAAGIIPLVSVLTEKGVGLGTTLAFMMAVTGLSFPEFMILKRVMRVKLIAIFAGIVTIGIIFTGYLFNAIL